MAEDVFLYDAPLRRQIMCARAIFALLQDISWALAEDKQRSVSRELEKKLQALCAYAAEPPFRGKPLVERAYREFLKHLNFYLEILHLGNEEGFFPHIRKDLNDSLADCRSAYNAFAALLNES